MSIGKVDFEWVEKRPIFAVCGPKFTKFGIPVGEWSQFPMLFSDRRYLVLVQRYLRSSRKMP